MSDFTDIDTRIKRILQIQRSTLQMIPGSKAPSNETIYSYVLAIRRNLGSNAALNSSSDLNLSISNQNENDEIEPPSSPLSPNKFNNQQKQIEELMYVVNHSVLYEDLISPLSQIVGLEPQIDSHNINEETISSLLEAIQEKMEEKDKTIDNIRKKTQTYRDKVESLLKSIIIKLPPSTQKQVQTVLNYKF